MSLKEISLLLSIGGISFVHPEKELGKRRYCRGEMEIYVIGRVFQVCKKKKFNKIVSKIYPKCLL